MVTKKEMLKILEATDIPVNKGRTNRLKFTGDTEHYVKPFKGTRYTLVYYHWS